MVRPWFLQCVPARVSLGELRGSSSFVSSPPTTTVSSSRPVASVVTTSKFFVTTIVAVPARFRSRAHDSRSSRTSAGGGGAGAPNNDGAGAGAGAGAGSGRDQSVSSDSCRPCCCAHVRRRLPKVSVSRTSVRYSAPLFTTPPASSDDSNRSPAITTRHMSTPPPRAGAGFGFASSSSASAAAVTRAIAQVLSSRRASTRSPTASDARQSPTNMPRGAMGLSYRPQEMSWPSKAVSPTDQLA